MDVDTARRNLIRTEAIRTDKNTRHVLWENGDTWLEDFEHLRRATVRNDTRLRHAVETASTPEARRVTSQDRMYNAREENEWNKRFGARIARTLAQQRAEPHPNRALLSELEQHQMNFQRYAADRQVVMYE
ncbi:hypothetical protein SE17_36790, partial [Kouleothrix aurantiaca]